MMKRVSKPNGKEITLIPTEMTEDDKMRLDEITRNHVVRVSFSNLYYVDLQCTDLTAKTNIGLDITYGEAFEQQWNHTIEDESSFLMQAQPLPLKPENITGKSKKSVKPMYVTFAALGKMKLQGCHHI